LQAVAMSKRHPTIYWETLKTADRYLVLHKAYPLPFLIEGINKYVMIDEILSYLNVTEDGQFFTRLIPYILSRYAKVYYMTCPSDFASQKKKKK
jgi:hypothetical protein